MPDVRDPPPIGAQTPPDTRRELRMQLSPDAAGLADGRAALRACFTASGVGERAAYYTELALEELMTNLIRHGRPAPGSVVDLALHVTGERVVLELGDDGEPFDPLAVPAPARPDGIDDAAVGGLGIFLVRETAEHMAYARIDGRNHLTVAIAQRGD